MESDAGVFNNSLNGRATAVDVGIWTGLGGGILFGHAEKRGGKYEFTQRNNRRKESKLSRRCVTSESTTRGLGGWMS